MRWYNNLTKPLD